MEGEKYIERLIFEKSSCPSQEITCNPILNLLITGICDEDCPLSIFAGLPHIINAIWNQVLKYWKTFIIEGVDFDSDPFPDDSMYLIMASKESKKVAFHALTSYQAYEFPEPKDIDINMMPFVMGTTFAESKLPAYLKPYWDAILDKEYFDDFDNCCNLIPPKEYGKIGYLTIHESLVKRNETQRRPGLHTDSPGKVTLVLNKNMEYVHAVEEEENNNSKKICDVIRGKGDCLQDITYGSSFWGGGACEPELVGGIYMMSSVSDSCEVYNCIVASGNDVIGDLGDVEHLKDVLPVDGRTKMKSNVMYWITDRTPHQSLPLDEDTYRQYFRLVTSEVSLWYEDHATKNPLGVVPDPSITKVVKGSKFKKK